MPTRSFSGVLVLVLVVVAACGPNAHHNSGENGGGGGGGGGGGLDATTCAMSTIRAEKTPLDIYVMLDQSGSMSDSVAGGGTKWTAVTSAIDTFTQQPGLDGVSVGLQYFAVPQGGGTCSVVTCMHDADCGAASCGPCVAGFCAGIVTSGGDSCTASDYAHAAVEIAPLPGVASAIHTSMGGHSPSTGTPTSAALQGAIDHASVWAHAHAGDAAVVVLATDGDPEECDTSLPDINAIAAAGLAQTPKILTFVIGVGPDAANLDGIAAAGGTMQAFHVDTNANTNQQFLAAMNAIRHTALGCTYQIPAPMGGGTVDYGAVNVIYTPGGGGSPQTIPYVMNKMSCPATGNGWYYDDPNMPTEIVLCDALWTTVEADTTGEVDISLGCKTVIL